MKIASFDCFSGISGDMTLGALIDAGADFDELKRELKKLDIHEYEITAQKVTKRGIAATEITVTISTEHYASLHHTEEGSHSKEHHGRSYADIKLLIESSRLADRVKERALAIFRRLGEAEAKIHNVDLESIHFHEIGSVDAIVDVVGTSVCLELLGIEKIYSSPMPTFYGTVEIAHGMFPLPAPATAEILRDVPWRDLGIEGELVTPTGAAIVAALAEGFGPMPSMNIQSVGYGGGKKDFGIPNVLRVMVGSRAEYAINSEEECQTKDSISSECEQVAVIETNIDDMSPQLYEVVMEQLLAAGALDVYLAPIQMKKNRPAILLSVICAPADVGRLSEILFRETYTIGVRIDTRDRICLPRESLTVETDYGPITVKVARLGNKVINVQPEYENCKTAALHYQVPVKVVREAAVAAFFSNKS